MPCYIPCFLSSSHNILNGAKDCSSQRLPKKTSRRTGYPTQKDIDYLQLKRWSLMVSKHCLPYKIKPTVSNGNLKSLCMLCTHFPAASFGLLWGWSMGLWRHLTDVTKWLFTGSVCPVSILQSKKKNKVITLGTLLHLILSGAESGAICVLARGSQHPQTNDKLTS